MDSLSVGQHMAENVLSEEMPRWQNPMFEAPNVNRQSFNNGSGNYADWGAPSFNESRRRGSARGKPNHHSKRNSGGHQQAPWPVDRGLTHSPPMSPQWQPQPPPPPPPPPPPSQTYTGFQEQQGPVAVNLSCLPGALCRQNFLEAMLDQAGLADEIMGCVLGEDQERGKAVIYLTNFNAALKCMQHFGGRRWDHAGPPVLAHIAEGSEPSTQNTGGDTPKAADSGSDTPQRQTSTRWADLQDDNKDHSEDPQSEGLEGSTSAGGSTGRYREESFSFGCEVDTDDGF